MNKDLLVCCLTAISLLFSCNSQTTCKYKPAPVFESGLPHVLQYNFEVQGQQSLESLLLDGERCDQLIKTGIANVRARFSATHMAEEFESVLREAVA